MEQTVQYKLALDYNCEIYGDTTIEIVRYVPEDDNMYEDERILLYSDSSQEYIKEFKKNFYKNCSNYDYIEELLKKDLMKFENLVDDINNIIKKFNDLKEDLDIDVFRCEVPATVINEVDGSVEVVVDVSIDNDKRPQVDKIVGIGSDINISCSNDHKDYILTPKIMADNFLDKLNKLPNIEFMEADIEELKSIVTQDVYDITGDMTSNVSSFRLTIHVRYSSK